MDEVVQKQHVGFVSLYNKGLIYRSNYIINRCRAATHPLILKWSMKKQGT